jgi:probable rRNA maturation factor
VIEIEVVNRSGREVDEAAAVELARSVLAREGIGAGELGLAFVRPEESRALKREHLGVDEATDALAFPIDGRATLPEGMPRQLGDVVVCPEVVADEWRGPLVHALLHLVGHDHGPEMEAREAVYTRRALDGRAQGAAAPASPATEREA